MTNSPPSSFSQPILGKQYIFRRIDIFCSLNKLFCTSPKIPRNLKLKSSLVGIDRGDRILGNFRGAEIFDISWGLVNAPSPLGFLPWVFPGRESCTYSLPCFNACLMFAHSFCHANKKTGENKYFHQSDTFAWHFRVFQVSINYWKTNVSSYAKSFCLQCDKGSLLR